MQSHVHSIQAVQNPWKSNTSKTSSCRYATKDANDAKGTERKTPVTVQKLMVKEQKEHLDTLCIATDPVHNEKIREKESGSAAEETVPDVRQARE